MKKQKFCLSFKFEICPNLNLKNCLDLKTLPKFKYRHYKGY